MERILEDKVAIITGANQGLGLEIARKYIEAGVRGLTLCARDAARLEQASEGLRKSLGKGQSVYAQVADVSNPQDVHALVDAHQAKYGQIDILVNNAGIYGPMGLIEEVDWTEWKQAIDINLYGSIQKCRAGMRYFKAKRRGKIVQLW